MCASLTAAPCRTRCKLKGARDCHETQDTRTGCGHHERHALRNAPLNKLDMLQKLQLVETEAAEIRRGTDIRSACSQGSNYLKYLQVPGNTGEQQTSVPIQAAEA